MTNVSPPDGAAPRSGPLTSAQIDFLKLTVAAAESHLRAYDTKAQITLAAFVLSLNPLWALFQSVCRHGVEAGAVTVLLVTVVATLVAYGATVWPASGAGAARAASQTEASPTSNLFFLAGDAGTAAHHYLAALAGVDVGEALADEAVKLARLRRAKAARLKLALVCTIASYALIVLMFTTRQQCS